LAKYKPQIQFSGKRFEYDPITKYLGVTIDIQLIFKQHIDNTAAKLKTRNNIIHKLVGLTWGTARSTLRTSSLALVYSAAEYASPIWISSSICRKIYIQLHHSMRIISGTVKSTPTKWLPAHRDLRLKSRKPAYLSTDKCIHRGMEERMLDKAEL